MSKSECERIGVCVCVCVFACACVHAFVCVCVCVWVGGWVGDPLGFEHGVLGPLGGDSRLRLPGNSLTDEASARDFHKIHASEAQK